MATKKSLKAAEKALETAQEFYPGMNFEERVNELKAGLTLQTFIDFTAEEVESLLVEDLWFFQAPPEKDLDEEDTPKYELLLHTLGYLRKHRGYFSHIGALTLSEHLEWSEWYMNASHLTSMGQEAHWTRRLHNVDRIAISMIELEIAQGGTGKTAKEIVLPPKKEDKPFDFLSRKLKVPKKLVGEIKDGSGEGKE